MKILVGSYLNNIYDIVASKGAVIKSIYAKSGEKIRDVNTYVKKGDILIDDFGVVECKTKMKPCTSFSIKKEWIDTVRKEAFEMNRTDWAIVFDFGVLGDEYAVIPLNDYKEFLEYQRGNK